MYDLLGIVNCNY